MPSNQVKLANDDLNRQLRRLTRRGFAAGAAAALSGLAGWSWLVTRAADGGLPWPLRRMLEWNERLDRMSFRATRLTAEYPPSAARSPRPNGAVGQDRTLDIAAWRLRVEGPGDERPARSFALEEITSLPRIEMTTELRCVEGWSQVVHWAGARLSDVARLTGLATRSGALPGTRGDEDLLEYASLETPDHGYYVGLDMPSALHPQTLLAYEMNGAPLNLDHGAPLRLVIPVKYGYKSLKQVGSIRFTDQRPADYWAERGFDWYAGH
jgi:DMSO/TMAO reductase YedYZ molybdopterin-dependent catalytic subunit